MRICLTQAQKDAEADEAYRKQIMAAMALNGFTQEKLAKALGMSRATLRSRLRNPAEIARGEDRRLRRLLRMEGAA